MCLISCNGIAEGSPWGAKSINGYLEDYLVYADATKTTLLACSSVAKGAIIIPDSVTSIGKNAFIDCTDLTSVTISNSVTSIRESAFWWCEALTSVVVESGNKVYDSRENCNAIIETATNTLIRGCNTTIIPNSVTSIGDYAFSDCSLALASITIPDSVTSIGTSAFEGCSSLVSVTIGNSVTYIGENIFCNCVNLQTIRVPKGMNTTCSINLEPWEDMIVEYQ